MTIFDILNGKFQRSVLEQLENIKERLDTMATEAELDAKLLELKNEIAAAAQRVLDKIAELIAGNPDLTDELADIQTDIEQIRAIAPVEPPPVP